MFLLREVADYALILVLIAIVVIAILMLVGAQFASIFSQLIHGLSVI